MLYNIFMRQGMNSHLEDSYVDRIDRHMGVGEVKGQGKPAEEFVARFYEGISGLKVRFSTPEEDKGPEIGGRQTVDLVVSFADGRAAFATQITSSDQRGVMEKKIKEMRDHPFIRLDEMNPHEVSIPKVLVFLDAGQIKNFFNDPTMKKYPELPLKVIDDHIRSLIFDLSQTQNPPQQKAVKELIQIFTEEKKKYTH